MRFERSKVQSSGFDYAQSLALTLELRKVLTLSCGRRQNAFAEGAGARRVANVPARMAEYLFRSNFRHIWEEGLPRTSRLSAVWGWGVGIQGHNYRGTRNAR